MKKKIFFIPILAVFVAAPIVGLSACSEDDPVEHRVQIAAGSDTTNLNINPPIIILNKQLVINYRIVSPLEKEIAVGDSWVMIGENWHPLSDFSYKDGKVIVPADKVVNYDISICLKTQESSLPHFSYEGPKVKSVERTNISISPIYFRNGSFGNITHLTPSLIEERDNLTISIDALYDDHLALKIAYDSLNNQTFYNFGFSLSWTYQGKEYKQDFKGFELQFNTDSVAFNFEYDETAWVDYYSGEPLDIPPFVYKEDYKENLWELTAKLSNDFIREHQRAFDLNLIGVKFEISRGGTPLVPETDYLFEYFQDFHSALLQIKPNVITNDIDIKLEITYDYDYDVDFNLYDGITITSSPEKGRTGNVYEFTYASEHQLTEDDVLVYITHTNEDGSKVWYETADFSNVEVEGNTIRLIINSYGKHFTICLAKHESDEQEAQLDGTMGLYSNTLSFFACNNEEFKFQYSFNGEDWFEYQTDDIIIIPAHKNFYLTGTNSSLGVNDYDESSLYLSWCGSFNLNGKCAFLLGPELTLSNYAFSFLFINTKVVSVTDNFLPTTTLTWGCYKKMFSGCDALVDAPNLPATNMQWDCYAYMFEDCVSLKQAPNLPATVLDLACYEAMFKNCKSLETVPTISGTDVKNSSFREMFLGCESITSASSITITSVLPYSCENMFSGCTSLVQAPELPATTLNGCCYRGMFRDCSSLENPPALPCENLVDFCYDQMFKNCVSLKKAPYLPAKTLANHCYSEMFEGCTSLNVSEDNGKDENLIFVCTSSEGFCCYDMFEGTDGPFIGSPTQGHKYYWNDPE